MSFVEIKLDGSDAIREKLQSIKERTAKKIVKTAIATALKPTLTAAKSNAVGMVGGVMGSMIAMALRIKPFRRQKNHSYGMNVQISRDYGNLFVTTTKKGLRHYIPAAIQYGHAKRGRTQKAIELMALAKRKWFGRKAAQEAAASEYGTDRVPAIPFMRKAADMTLPQTPSIFGNTIKRELSL
jgi:hypothetical protein